MKIEELQKQIEKDISTGGMDNVRLATYVLTLATFIADQQVILEKVAVLTANINRAIAVKSTKSSIIIPGRRG